MAASRELALGKPVTRRDTQRGHQSRHSEQPHCDHQPRSELLTHETRTEAVDGVGLSPEQYRNLSAECRLAQGLPAVVTEPTVLRLVRRAFANADVMPTS